MNKTLMLGLFALLLLPSFASAALTDNIDSYYKFDVSDANQIDELNFANGTVTDAVFTTVGIIDGAYEYAGVTEWISYGDNFDVGTGDFTISAWVNFTVITSGFVLAKMDQNSGTGGGLDLNVDSSSRLNFRLFDGGFTTAQSTNTVSIGTWYFVVLTRNGTTMNLTVNDAQWATASSAADVNNAYNFLTGATHNSASAGDGWITCDCTVDEVGIWIGRTLSAAEKTELYNSGAGLTYPFSAGAPNASYATVVVKDYFDNATLSGLTVHIGNNSNVTDGSGIATVYYPSNLSYTVDGGSLYYNISGTATENASVTAYPYGAYVDLEAYNVLGDALTTFNVSSGAFSNTTSTGTAKMYLKPNASNMVQFDAATYISKNYTITTTGKDTGTYNASGLYQTVINITGKSRVDNTTINGFTLNYTGANGDVVNGSETTTGANITLFNMLGNYSLTFDNSSFELGYYALNATTAAEPYEFYLYTSNSINFTFFDEETGVKIQPETVYLELISTAQAGNYSTTTGSIYEDLLSPDAYTLRYTSLGYSETFYYLTLVDRTFTALNLTLLNASSASNVTITVYDTLGNKLEGATVKVLKYDISTNTYPIVEIVNTNFEGVAKANILLNSEYYKFIIDYEGETRLTTTPTYIYGTTLTFYIPTENSGMEDYFNEAEISGTLSFNYGTNLATFVYSDLDNTATQGCLYAYTTSLGVNTLVNTSCSSSSSGSLNLFIYNSSTSWYLEGVVTKSAQANTISTYRVDFITKLNESGSGAFFAFILLATIVFIGLFSLEVAVVIAAAVPLLFTVTKLADFDYVISIPILLLGLVTAFVIGSNKK